MPYSNKLKACLTCRKTFVSVAGEKRCPQHQAEWQAQRNAAGRACRPQNYSERVEHQELIQEWVRRNGWWCPGLDQHIAHEVAPGRLSVHHLQAVAEGGSRVGGDKAILCKLENARLGGELRRRPTG
jgi:hypothetical protein